MRISNSVYGINSRDVITNIKIEKDKIISGRIIKYDKESGQALLKLVSGEEIAAEIKGSYDNPPENIIKLKVTDVSDNQIKLKIIDEDNKPTLSPASLKDNEEMLLKLLNHNFSLTKENLEFIDSIKNMAEIFKNTEDIDAFLKDLLLSKGADINTAKGLKIFNQLKEFAAEFKNLSLEDILNLLENNIDLTPDNIKSYNRIMEEPNTILKDILLIGRYLSAEKENKILNNLMKDELKSAVNNLHDKAKSVTAAWEGLNKDGISKILDIFGRNINDFKVYNSISNNYYYIDLPVKHRENEYQFKLIIKNDRKNGQIIDKDNVSMAVSIKTKNMGITDIFLKIKSSNMDITINAEKSFLSLIKSMSGSLQSNLIKIKPVVNISVKEKAKELNISSYNEFFSDGEFNSLNIYV